MVVIARTQLGWNYWHVALQPAGLFVDSSFRTLDVGREGSNMMVRGKLKSSHHWATQAWRIARANVKIVRGRKEGLTLKPLDYRTGKILQSIRSNFGVIRVQKEW